MDLLEAASNSTAGNRNSSVCVDFVSPHDKIGIIVHDAVRGCSPCSSCFPSV